MAVHCERLLAFRAACIMLEEAGKGKGSLGNGIGSSICSYFALCPVDIFWPF